MYSSRVSRPADPALSSELERVIVGAVALTARALADVAPELTFLQWRVLVVVGECQDGAAVSTIAARIGSRLPATSRVLSRLRRRGLVDARQADADGRVKLIALTDAGRSIVERVVTSRRRTLDEALAHAGLTDGDRPSIRRLVDALEPFA